MGRAATEFIRETEATCRNCQHDYPVPHVTLTGFFFADAGEDADPPSMTTTTTTATTTTMLPGHGPASVEARLVEALHEALQVTSVLDTTKSPPARVDFRPDIEDERKWIGLWVCCAAFERLANAFKDAVEKRVRVREPVRVKTELHVSLAYGPDPIPAAVCQRAREVVVARVAAAAAAAAAQHHPHPSPALKQASTPEETNGKPDSLESISSASSSATGAGTTPPMAATKFASDGGGSGAAPSWVVCIFSSVAPRVSPRSTAAAAATAPASSEYDAEWRLVGGVPLPF